MDQKAQVKASFRGLKVWERARDLAIDVHRTTAGFPRHELFGLTAQLRSSAISVPANIAEGKGRRSGPDFIRFLRIAAGSLAELETYFDIAEPLTYLKPDDRARLQAKADEVGKMLYGLIDKLQSS